jgi:GNAT superfamily N-acetyltransferase
MITLTTAATHEHLEGILALQQRNHLHVVPDEAQSREGFVYVRHTLPVLARMAAASPQAIALDGDRVVGYCLSLPPSLQHEVPILAPMFEQFGRCRFRDTPLAETRYVVGGQVCVDHDYRGQGLLARLYRQVRDSLGSACEVCVTEIATRNEVSVRAHEKMGFAAIARYNDGREDWVIVAWDLAADHARA